ncbi:MAG: hypothetical protein NVSMB53_06120 [Gemmatimonadaceae bacterium]
MDTGSERFGFFLEPVGDGGDRGGVVEHVSEEGFRDTNGANEPHVGSMKRRHQRDASKAP